MHKYLRAVGFSNIKTNKQLEQLLEIVEDSYQTEKTSVGSEQVEIAERTKEFAPGIGIKMFGTYDEQEQFHREYYVPYCEGDYEKFYENLIIERHAEKESYAGIFDDVNRGVSVIFYLQNVVDFLNADRKHRLSAGNAAIKLSGLSVTGKVLLPMKKPAESYDSFVDMIQHSKMVRAARDGDQDAIESLTLEEMDTYSMISRRVAREDILSIVSSSFIPYGVECDQYTLIGEILESRCVKNTMTQEEIYKLRVECNDFLVDICIHKEDLLGEPEAGRRFRGIVWLQGNIVYQS